MKISSFNPLITTADAQPIIELFEALGFEVRHRKTGIQINGKDVFDVRMRDANGFHVDVAQVPGWERDTMSIRMNVDDYDEANAFLTERGFVNALGDRVSNSGSSKGTRMIAPSGFQFALSHHFKEHE